jgi:ribosomal-protein-alanine N-acetyltransferase
MNADPEVMRWFPSTLTRAESDAAVDRQEAALAVDGLGFWAVEVVESARGAAPFVGFVGLAVPRFDEVPFAYADPLVEVGWRLARAWWGLGIATEAAASALSDGFDRLGLAEVVSYTTPPNLASQAVMQRLGMRYDGVFQHPRAAAADWWGPHVLYRLGAHDRRASSGG